MSNGRQLLTALDFDMTFETDDDHLLRTVEMLNFLETLAGSDSTTGVSHKQRSIITNHHESIR